MPFISRSAPALPWLLPMGLRLAVLSALPLLLATPALAQQQDSAPPVFNLPDSQPQPSQKQQGPELDVFRGAPTPATPPPVIVPSITVPPAVTPAPAPPPQSAQQPASTPQTRQPTAQTPTERQSTPATQAPLPAAETAPTNTAPAPAETPAPMATQPAPTPEPAAPLQPASPGNDWVWLAGTAALVLLILGVLLFRRRNRAGAEEEFISAAEPEPAPPAPKPVQPTAPTPAPATAAPSPAPVSSDRPWIDLILEVRSARFSLMGATINYALTIHNRGEQVADDILIRSMIANADADQQSILQQFFTGVAGLPVHSMVSISPGESQSVTGELRLAPDQIAPVKMGDRTLLIPLVAFDAQYRWGVEDSAPSGTGRTGRAFIVGQEQTPPTDRLSPFRLDLGPRQFRAPASRATALTLAR